MRTVLHRFAVTAAVLASLTLAACSESSPEPTPPEPSPVATAAAPATGTQTPVSALPEVRYYKISDG